VGLRETINRNPSLVGVASVVLVVAAILIVVLELRPGATKMPAAPVSDQGFFSKDDGKGFFAADVKKATPYKEGGSDVVRAHVFKCKSGAAFVGYLQRDTELGRQELQKGNTAFELAHRPPAGRQPYFEVKKPGAQVWVPFDGEHIREWEDIRAVKCPDGAPASEVLPGEE